MKKNRKKTEKFILEYIEKITRSKENVEIYKTIFGEMDDNEFDKYMTKLKNEEIHLSVIVPPFSDKVKITVENNLKIAEELNHDFFQKLWIKSGNSPEYLTNNEYIVIDLPIRRTSQLIAKKISVPEHNKTVDVLTGQPVGDSKGAKISYSEVQVLSAIGLEDTLIEVLKYRGGDKKGLNAMNAMIARYGHSNLKTLKNYSSGVKSTKTLSTFLTAMHLKNRLVHE